MSNETEHTPGPWTADRSETEPYSFIEGANGHLIASVHLGDHPDSGTESGENEHRANARLIAAAPELLEAAEAAKELIQVELGVMTPEDARVMDLLRTAIAKARGEQ